MPEKEIIPTVKDNPCFNCKDRKIGCHGKCEKYKEFRKRVEDLREKEREYRNYRSSRVISRYSGK